MNTLPKASTTQQRVSIPWLTASITLILALLAGCMPIQPAAAPKAVTLRFAIAAGQGSPRIDNYVQEFVTQVHDLSQGMITVEPVWDAGADAPDGLYEAKAIQRVQQGDFELGMAPSRAFDMQQIFSFQPLQAPFLIANDALAEAVATSDIATKMLEHLSSAGMVGLTLWPEDLRHPFSIVPDKPFLSLQDFAGVNIRTPRSDIGYQLINALGGTAMYGDGGYQGAESGLQQGGTLTGRPIATGNVTFYPKYEVLFANAAAFTQLTDQQRMILRQAAIATQKKALANRPKEVDAAATYCADGGTIVLASDEQVKAFEQAAQPVFDQIEKDPLNAELIAAIRDLKAKVTPAPGAAACGSQAVQQSPAPAADNQVWSPGLPPNGTWQVEVTTEDLMRMGELQSVAIGSAGVYTWTFQDGKAVGHFQSDQGQSGQCTANYAVVEDFVRLTFYDSPDCRSVADIQWRLDTDGLRLHLVAIQGAPFLENKAYLEAKPWQQVEAWSPGLPPNGVWQVELTTEDFVSMGVLRSVAETGWAGVYTITFQDGKYVMIWEGLQGQFGRCQADYELIEEDIMRLTLTSDPSECSWDHPDDIRWRIDDEGLHLHLVPQNSGFVDVESTAFYEAKPWQKVEAWSPGLPPNGTWQVTETVDDFVRMGLLRSVAQSDWAGVTTLTFQDGQSLEVWHGESGKSGKCQAHYEVVGDVVRFTYFGNPDECPNRVDEMQWRVDEQGLLHLHLVSTKNAPFVEIRSYLEAKPWQKVK
ncbi:MAG: hypothetical protein U0175_28770 [Caldilineaceae bacterium]